VHFIQASADGRRLVNQGRPGRVALIEMTGPQMRGLELEHVNAGKVAISPDGRWAASGPVHGRAAVVWDFDSAEVVLRQPGRSETMTAAPVFSPDGRWLLICMGEEIVLYQVPVWTAPRWRIPRPEPIQISTPAAFSGDGELLAAGVHWRTIRLIRAGTGEELATLEAPGHDFVNAIDVSHDGRWIAAGTVAGEVHFWDLARIRPALRDLNLDWDGPPRLEPAEGPGVAPVRVEIAAEEPEAGTPARR
jgi:WD40 repeat protein